MFSKASAAFILLLIFTTASAFSADENMSLVPVTSASTALVKAEEIPLRSKTRTCAYVLSGFARAFGWYLKLPVRILSLGRFFGPRKTNEYYYARHTWKNDHQIERIRPEISYDGHLVIARAYTLGNVYGSGWPTITLKGRVIQEYPDGIRLLTDDGKAVDLRLSSLNQENAKQVRAGKPRRVSASDNLMSEISVEVITPKSEYRWIPFDPRLVSHGEKILLRNAQDHKSTIEGSLEGNNAAALNELKLEDGTFLKIPHDQKFELQTVEHSSKVKMLEAGALDDPMPGKIF